MSVMASIHRMFYLSATQVGYQSKITTSFRFDLTGVFA